MNGEKQAKAVSDTTKRAAIAPNRGHGGLSLGREGGGRKFCDQIELKSEIPVHMGNIQHHFSKIACRYRDLRMTDLEPILFIKGKLKGRSQIRAVDVGCGAGRYDLRLFQNLGRKIYLYCIDANEEMLKRLNGLLVTRRIKNFQTIGSSAENLPLEDNSVDCVFTFNAIHHFKVRGFLRESSRILKGGGYLFVYTRLRRQNGENIWGTYFPLFNEKETRLYELNELKSLLRKTKELKIESIEYFKYARVSCLDRLIYQVENCHYSTFALYSPKEFNKAMRGFKRNIQKHFEDIKNITWFDENILLVIKKL